MREFFQSTMTILTVAQLAGASTDESEHSFNAFFIPEGKPFGDTFPFYKDGVWHLFCMWMPHIGHFATRDHFITRPMVEGFERALTAAGRPHEIHWYEADHAFANPTGPDFAAAEAQRAWQRTLDFFRRTIG